MSDGNRRYPTLKPQFFPGSLHGQIDSVYKERNTKPEKLADFKRAIADGAIWLDGELPERQVQQLIELGITVPLTITIIPGRKRRAAPGRGMVGGSKMSMKRDNKYWGRTLANDYKNETGCSRRIRLPDADHIKFDGEEEHVTVTMEETAIIANLQTNAAAFEAWSLALHVWSKVPRINLVWKPPGKGCTDEGRRHYQRFLYRAERFHELFPLWFHLARPELLDDA